MRQEGGGKKIAAPTPISTNACDVSEKRGGEKLYHSSPSSRGKKGVVKKKKKRLGMVSPRHKLREKEKKREDDLAPMLKANRDSACKKRRERAQEERFSVDSVDP